MVKIVIKTSTPIFGRPLPRPLVRYERPLSAEAVGGHGPLHVQQPAAPRDDAVENNSGWKDHKKYPRSQSYDLGLQRG
jgi:hypothetical protein